jgi:lipopolysaccharide/colanic/teichoic acid biosynthesis glycosyltransferase
MYKKYLKRILDILICICFFPLFSLIFLMIAILIKLDDKGPIFYNADRIGENSIIFKMIKFRTMKLNAPLLLNPDGSTYNAKNDPRVTKIGKFLRSSSLDETPQIINVLLGDMSIVGPRASLSSAIGTFKEDEIDKMNVKPGITGYVQAYYRNALTNREKRLKDAWYANNVSFLLDIKILFMTLKTVFSRSGLYTNR